MTSLQTEQPFPLCLQPAAVTLEMSTPLLCQGERLCPQCPAGLGLNWNKAGSPQLTVHMMQSMMLGIQRAEKTIRPAQ